MATSPEMAEQFCYSLCPSNRNNYNCPVVCIPLTPQFPFPPFRPPSQSNSSQHVPRIVIVIVVLAGIFLLVSIFSLIIKHSSMRNIFRNSTNPRSNAHQDHDQINNRASRVRAVGLEESVINLITVCKYKRGECRVEGTECSICLSEFREGEDLRMLPNCGHAFHLPCIDTWLKSHQSCPLCRAKVVSDQMKFPSTDPSSPDESGDEPQMGNSQGNIGLRRNRGNGPAAISHTSVHMGATESRDMPPSRVNNGFRSNSELNENNRSRECIIQINIDDGMKRIHRSVSMDSSVARMLSISTANLPPVNSEGSSTSKEDERSNSVESMGSKSILHKHSSNQTIYKTMNSQSEGSSVQEKPPSTLKRSFSGGGKFLLTRY